MSEIVTNDPVSQEVTQAWKSRTLWISAITAIAPLFPPVAALMAANPEAVSALIGAVFFALRVKTSSKVTIKK